MDTELVTRAQHGDEEAFASLAVAIGDRLHAVAQRILRDVDLAEDATQQALLSIWRDLPQLRDPAKFEAWSYRLLLRACYAEGRRTRHWTPTLRVLPSAAAESDASGLVVDRDQLERGFRRLSIDHRAVVVLHHYLDMPIEQVAETLGVPPGTVRSRLHYAMQGLRAALEADARPATRGRRMTAELDATRVVRAWLEEGATRLPDHVLDAVLADIPTTAQRRRISAVDGAFRRARWARLLVALMMVALVGASLALATGAWRVAPIPRPFEVRPLDIGRYVIDDPFPVRISLDVPDGWEGVDLGNDTAAIALSAGGDAGAALTFTLVEGVYPDPCHWAESSLVRVGPIVDDLAAALAGTRGVVVTGPVATDFGGYAAQHVTLDAPKSFTGCTNIDDPFHLWGIPQTHSLMPGEHDQIWISQVGSTRLVAYSEVYPTTPRAVVEELGRIVASIRLERFAAIAETSPTPAPTEIPSWPSIVDGAPLEHIGYEQRVHLYEYLPDGSVRPVAARYVASLLGQSGWLGREQGMAKDAGTRPRARVGWSSVASVYLDPCHWQTSTLGTADPPLMRNQDGLTEALNGWWPTATDSKASAGYRPSPVAPQVSKPPKAIGWNGLLVQELELTIPARLDLASCDAGEYRLWETNDGQSRTAAPGERIQLDVIDFEPGLIVVDMSWLPSASPAVIEQARDARLSLWIGRP